MKSPGATERDLADLLSAWMVERFGPKHVLTDWMLLAEVIDTEENIPIMVTEKRPEMPPWRQAGLLHAGHYRLQAERTIGEMEPEYFDSDEED